MNSRQSWLLSCLSEKNCRRCTCMYIYLQCTTGTPGRRGLSEPLRLCLLCMQMSSPIHVLSHRRHSPFSPTPQLVQPFSLTPLPSSSSWRRSPSLRVPRFCFSASSFAFGICLCLRGVRRHQSSRGEDEMRAPEATSWSAAASRECLRACRDIAIKARVDAKFA